MIWFFINTLCLLLYFVLASVFLYLLYFLKILPNDTRIRFGFNILDFYLDILKMLSYDQQHKIPDSFNESGIVIYEGPQGSGKTISMIRHVMVLQHKYKKVKVMDNLGYEFTDFDIQNPNDILKINNDVFGVITSLDELGIWFNARKFKEFDNSMLQVIFENRKCRRLLLGTCQKFLMIDKNLRIQTSMIISCMCLGPVVINIKKIPIMDSEGTVQRYQFKGINVFVQSNDLRNAYDTYHVIKKYDLS